MNLYKQMKINRLVRNYIKAEYRAIVTVMLYQYAQYRDIAMLSYLITNNKHVYEYIEVDNMSEFIVKYLVDECPEFNKYVSKNHTAFREC